MPAREQKSTGKFWETGTSGWIEGDPSDSTIKQRVESGSLREMTPEEVEATRPHGEDQANVESQVQKDQTAARKAAARNENK